MTNRERLINRLQSVSPDLGGELNYFMGIEHEDSYDLADAFEDCIDSAASNNFLDSFWKEIKSVCIELGYAFVRDPNTQTFGGHVKKYWFKHKKIQYDSVGSWEQWINE